MLDPKSCDAPDVSQALSPPGAVAWALTRDKECAELANRDPRKCFRGKDIVFAGVYVPEPYYFDTVEAACERLSNEIAAGKIETNPADWRATKNEDWLENTSVQIDFGDLQSVLPAGDPRFLSSKSVSPPVLLDDDPTPRLTTAALWIATVGGSVECNVADVEVWKPAFDALIKKIRNNEMDLLSRWGDGTLEKISGYKLEEVSIDYPYQDRSGLVFSETPYLLCYAIGVNDDLVVEGRAKYTDLRVTRTQLLEHWPRPLPKKLRPSRRGTTMKYDWPDLYKFISKTMEERGDFREWDSCWKCQADLERKACQYMEKQSGKGKGPSESRLRDHVKIGLEMWRERQLGADN